MSHYRTKFLTLLFFTFFCVVSVLPLVGIAQGPGGGTVGPGDTTVSIPNPLAGAGASNLLDFMKLVFDNVIIPVGGIVLALGIIWSGFLFVTAQGNATKLATAQKAFFWSFIGGLVLLGAWAIAKGIESTINSIRGLP